MSRLENTPFRIEVARMTDMTVYVNSLAGCSPLPEIAYREIIARVLSGSLILDKHMSMASRLDDFISGFIAAVELRNRAGELGAFIEAICLSATVIDAALRIGLILKHQLRTESSEIPSELLHQAENDKPVSERHIYRKASEQAVIDRALFERLELLYQQRNRVVHRYITSELTTQDVLRIALDYEHTIGKVSEAVDELEREQIRKGVGMTHLENESFEMKYFLELSKRKHGGESLTKILRAKAVMQEG